MIYVIRKQLGMLWAVYNRKYEVASTNGKLFSFNNEKIQYYRQNVCVPPINSYDEILTPKVMALGSGALGGNQVTLMNVVSMLIKEAQVRPLSLAL